jgi:hypothetical protein
MCLKERISKKDLDNGLFDELPDRLKVTKSNQIHKNIPFS